MNIQSNPPAAHRMSRLFLLDIALFVLALMAATAVLLPDFSGVGRVLTTVLVTSVPIAVAVVPIRIMFAALRQSCCKAVSVVVATLLGFAGTFTLDSYLREGPDGTRAMGYIANDPALVPISPAANGTVGLVYLRAGEPWSASDGAPLLDCMAHCKMLLQHGLAQDVVMLSSATMPAPAARYRLSNGGVCPAQSVPVSNTDIDLCATHGPDAQPERVYIINQLSRLAPRFKGGWPIRMVHRVTIRSGAVSQTVHVVRASTVQGGGLIQPVIAAWRGEQIAFSAQTRTREFAAFDTTRTGPLPKNEADRALTALFAQTLGPPPDRYASRYYPSLPLRP